MYMHVYNKYKKIISWNFTKQLYCVLTLILSSTSYQSSLDGAPSPYFYFLLNFAYIQLFSSQVLSNSPLCFLYSFLVSVVTPGFILSTEDLQVGTIDEKDHGTFVPLGLSYLPQYDFF